jgi:hypothetical protein
MTSIQRPFRNKASQRRQSGEVQEVSISLKVVRERVLREEV